MCKYIFAVIAYVGHNFDLLDIIFLQSVSPNYDIIPKIKSVYFILIHFKKLFLSFSANCNALGCK